ncbi:NADH-quinone oxidoreductase subunit NuoG [Estrella lausannensis]|uniref:NADH-quinone oxidoreductase subunit NuoG n=1 Tax=Estrella lausannensis TaxID=483423 RepID=UPI00194E81F1|nr:NADH-quinone oxidoreductase subunit NuoG [Estrella lausannensis]
MESKKVKLTIDGKEIEVPQGTTVYHAAKSLGIDLPIFCYHDRMPPFGACRVCLVEVDNFPKLQTSCTLEAKDGMNVKTSSKIAQEGRESILEFLLINHPLDCPICDKGGECPLQDQTLKFGPGISRFFEEKRKLAKKLPLGPVLMLDRERCIACARCTRFGDIVSGDHALEFVQRGYKTEIGTPGGGPAESKYIGNTIMICPVGALTSQVYRFRARPWDNDSVASTCTLCPVGCSLKLDSRDGEILRTRSHEDPLLNDIWLCDKGWFGYEHVDSADRLKTPLIRVDGSLKEASWTEALDYIADRLKNEKRAAAFGGNALTFEESYLFQQIFRSLGIPHIDHRIGMPEFSLNDEGLFGGMEEPPASLSKLSFALILGCDITEEFPVLWLRLKSALNQGAEAYFFGHFAPEVRPYFKETHLLTPGDEEASIAKVLALAEQLLNKGGQGAILVGSQYLNSPSRKNVLEELIRFRMKSKNLALHLLDACEGSLGAREAGMHPETGPFNQPLDNPGLSAKAVLQKGASEGWGFLWVAGSNPAAKYSRRVWKKFRENLGTLVCQDLFLTETAQEADVVLPVLSFAEKTGSFISISGKVQKLNPGKEIPEGIYSDEMIFHEIGRRLGVHLPGSAEMSVSGVAPSLHRIPKRKAESFDRREERQSSILKSENSSGMIRATFSRPLFDQGVRMKKNPHLSRSAKEPFLRLHPDEAKPRGFSDGDKIRVSTPAGSIVGKLKLDSQVAKGTLVLPIGFEELPVSELESGFINGFTVDLEKE